MHPPSHADYALQPEHNAVQAERQRSADVGRSPVINSRISARPQRAPTAAATAAATRRGGPASCKAGAAAIPICIHRGH